MAEDNTIYDGDADDSIDFQEEASNLSGYFTPDTGKTEIEFLDNGTKDTVTYDDDGEKQKKPVVKFKVSVDGEKKTWTVNKAQSPSSLYGQLVKVGADRGGLVGETIHLIRQGTGTDTQYTVEEAADL